MGHQNKARWLNIQSMMSGAGAHRVPTVRMAPIFGSFFGEATVEANREKSSQA